MRNEIKTHLPNIIALGFYDGATEGFTVGHREGVVCYFKIIAWDGDQDTRLYVVSEIDSSAYDEFVMILLRNGEIPSPLMWIPPWRFRVENDERRANQIVDDCKRTLLSSHSLVLGYSIDDINSKKIELADSRIRDIRELLNHDHPADLADLSRMLHLPLWNSTD